MPLHTSILQWISEAYDQQLGVVMETLASAMMKSLLELDRLCRSLLEVTQEYETEHKLGRSVMNNASNNDTMMEEV